MKKMLILSVLLASLLLSFQQAQAATATFYLTESNTFADGVKYAQVDVTENGGNLGFFVKALEPANWKLSNFYFNLGGSTGKVTLTNLPAGWSLASGNAPFNVSEFGLFTNGIKGGGSFLLNEFSFVADGVNPLSLVNLIANGKGWIFAGHVQCQNKNNSPCSAIGNVSSHFIAGPDEVSNVPVPAAAWLFGSAIAGLGTVGRRKKA